MHANLNLERNDWRLPADETVQVLDPKSKKIQSLYRNNGSMSLKNNWRAVVLALAVIGAVLLAVLTAVLILGAEDESVTWLRVPYELSDILDETAATRVADKGKHAHWMSAGTSLAYWDSFGAISIVHVQQNLSVTLLAAALLRQWQTEEFFPSPCGRFLLLKQRNAEFDLANRYAVYDTHQRRSSDSTLLQHASWLPKEPASLSVVYKNNIYLVNNITDNNQQWLQLAQVNGQRTYNLGELKQLDYLWPSPDNQWIVYPRIDTSQLTELFHIDYDKNGVVLDRISYSKPGAPLPPLQLRARNVENVDSDELPVEPSIQNLNSSSEFYLLDVKWLNDESFLVTWLHRSQTRVVIDLCTGPQFSCKKFFSEQTPSNQRLSPPQLFPSLKGGSSRLMYIARSFYQLENKGQLLYFDKFGERPKFLHHKQISIVEIISWDEENSIVYVNGRPLESLEQQHLYAISYSESAPTSLKCLTCGLTEHGCGYSDSKFNLGADYFILYCLGPDLITASVRKVSDLSEITSLYSTDDSRREMLRQLTPRRRRLQMRFVDGSTVQIQILLPLAWKDSAHDRRKFPLLIEIPDWKSESLPTDRWKRDWSTYLAVTRQVIYAQINGRERSSQFGSILHAADDIFDIISHIVESLDHVDRERVAVIGTGVGGYVTLAALTNDREHQFLCGIAVSPIVDWALHETYVSEHFLGLYDIQHEYYISIKLDNYISRVRNDSLLLIDPISQDPLHQIHSMKLSKLLVESGIRFKQQIYPDANLAAVQHHAYNTMGEFLDRCLDNK